TPGATMAPVGQISMQALHVPQCALTGCVGCSAKSTKISPRNNIEPASRDNTSECLPRQHRPLRTPSSFSSTDEESEKTRWLNGSTSDSMLSHSLRKRPRTTL